ncbi:HlyD family type I secretion periplasmic adaptor subunit [Pseudoalteromonas sp. T1lg88]|uniref:HlyD family type I secretion periplasmic adaptor subunit n=1 Tax=Pseudoalteromonas sp. T1lg88 TaxID=2077104 RepID=UPI000CF61CD4|nr:HlyD family type I secretion periplasmic adaptor subunit [Pseudoalteromonas sp. T1lg88]
MSRELSKTYYEFLPAALEVQSAPPPKFARSIVWTLVALLIIAVLWACIGKVDIVAVATGKVTPKQQVKVIQPVESGVIRAIHVVEGQKVKKGELLIELDPAINAADTRNLAEQKADITQQISRLTLFAKYLQNGQRPNVNGLNTEQQALLHSELNTYDKKVDALNAEIQRLNAELQAVTLAEQQVKLTLPLIQERTHSLAKLESTKMVAREQYLALKQDAITMEQQLLIEGANIARLKAAIKSAASNLAQQQAEQLQSILSHKHELTARLHQVSQELTKSEFLEGKTRLEAPVSGTVENLVVTTLGGVVTPAQEILRIVPEDDELIVEAGLLNKDIGFTYPGQAVEVKIESFPFTRYGIIEGEVIDVSTDAVEHEQLGLIFPVKVALKQQSIQVDGRKVPLSAGMTVFAEVKTGQRKIIEFLLSPIVQHVDEGARER